MTFDESKKLWQARLDAMREITASRFNGITHGRPIEELYRRGNSTRDKANQEFKRIFGRRGDVFEPQEVFDILLKGGFNEESIKGTSYEPTLPKTPKKKASK